MPTQPTLWPDEPEPALQPIQDKNLVILLDLNYTLVGNSPLKKKQGGLSYAAKIRTETYRPWLIELVRGHTVLLCTVRHQDYEVLTLERIRQETGWLPEGSYFNPVPKLWDGGIVKARYLERIFPLFGHPDERPYFAIESANSTKAMYKRHQIASVSVKNQQWTSLPLPVGLL